MDRYEVIVAGSGPSGSQAARLCSDHGMEVLLLERASHPRPKCCAGGMLERSLNQLEGGIPSRLIERELDSFTLVNGKEKATYDLKKRIGVTVRREEFDAHLAREAERCGAVLLENTSVVSAEHLPDGIEVETDRGKFRGRFLVIAEGARGSLANSLLGPREKGAMAVGLAKECEVESPTGSSLIIHLFGNSRSRGPHAFPLNGAAFPLKGAITASVVSNQSSKNQLLTALDLMVADIDNNFGIKNRRETCAHPIPLAPRKKLCSNRVLAVGDAAGLVSPFSGEGLTYAFKSARLAFEAIDRAMEGTETLMSYQAMCNSEIIFHMKAARFLSPALHWFTGLTDMGTLMRTFGGEDELLERIATAATGEYDWRPVLSKVITRFPRLFFSSL